MSEPTRYVLGFLFSESRSHVVLIRKRNPKWMSGLLNGLGGKIEDGETALEAMVREFREEAGVDTSQSGWRKFCHMAGDDWSVEVFKAFDSEACSQASTTTDEPVEKHSPGMLAYVKHGISNVPWLVHMALDDGFCATANYRNIPPYIPPPSDAWIGVDLDGTLAHYTGYKGSSHIGEPIAPMVDRVKRWLAEGKRVKIFTARMHGHRMPLIGGEVDDALTPIQQWCQRHIGQVLEVTNVKDFGMRELWDDRAVQVLTNQGIPVGPGNE